MTGERGWDDARTTPRYYWPAVLEVHDRPPRWVPPGERGQPRARTRSLEFVDLVLAARLQSDLQRGVLIWTARYANDDGVSWVAASTIATGLDVDPGSVRRAYHQLVDDLLVWAGPRTGLGRQYALRPVMLALAAQRPAYPVELRERSRARRRARSDRAGAHPQSAPAGALTRPERAGGRARIAPAGARSSSLRVGSTGARAVLSLERVDLGPPDSTDTDADQVAATRRLLTNRTIGGRP